MSIVEGNASSARERRAGAKNFIESTRRQIVALRDEVQGAAMTPGFSTKSLRLGKVISSIGSNKSKGYGKAGYRRRRDDAGVRHRDEWKQHGRRRGGARVE